MSTVRPPDRSDKPLPPLRKGQPLPLRKGLDRLNRKYAKTLEKLAK
jgi:hypothetical protein